MQVIPIVLDQNNKITQDKNIQNLIKKEKLKFIEQTKKNKGIFSNMQDWNPAEIVGRNPRNLAIDIYEYIITNKIWAIQRKQFGYKYPKSSKLIQNFCGKPYVDCLKSFYSFIPDKIDNKLTNKLMEFYREKLLKNDRQVEFQVPSFLNLISLKELKIKAHNFSLVNSNSQ